MPSPSQDKEYVLCKRDNRSRAKMTRSELAKLADLLRKYEENVFRRHYGKVYDQIQEVRAHLATDLGRISRGCEEDHQSVLEP